MVTAKDYAAKFTKEPDQQTALGIASVTAQAGHDWSELSKQDKSQEELAKAAEKLALDSVAGEKTFLDRAGTKPLVAAYVKDLIDRSKAKDKEQNKPEGTNLIAYLDKTAEAVNKEYPGQKFDEMKAKVEDVFKSGDPSFVDKIRLSSDMDRFTKIRAEIRKASAEHIGTDGRPVEEDFLHTLREKTKTPAQQEITTQPEAKKKNHFDDVKLTTDELPEKGTGSPDFMKAIGKLLEALLGFDIIGMFKAKDEKEASPKEAAKTEPKLGTVETAAGKAEVVTGVVDPEKTFNEAAVAAFVKANGQKAGKSSVDDAQQKPDTFSPTTISFKPPVKEAGSSRT